MACWDSSLKHWGSSEVLKVLLHVSTALHRPCGCLPQPGRTTTNTGQLHLYPQNSEPGMSVQKTTLDASPCQLTIKGLPGVNCYGCNRKRAAAGPSLRNTFKNSAVDLQMTVNTWGKVLRTEVRDPRIRGITCHFLFRGSNTVCPKDE